MMNKKEISAKIGTIVKEIYEQHEYLSENPGHVNELELELFLANSKFLTGHIEILQKLARTETEPKQTASIAEASAPAVQVPQTPEPVAEITAQADVPETMPAPAEDENVTRFFLEADPIEDDIAEDSFEQENLLPGGEETAEDIAPAPLQPEPVAIAPEAATEQVKASAPAQESTAPVTEPGAVPTVNDIISAQLNTQPTLAGQFTAKPVKDLKSIINLNDKLLFVKDLFNGYSLAYSEAIELLNRFDGFEAADNFLKSNYSVKNNWADKQGTVDHFYEILNRRFGR